MPTQANNQDTEFRQNFTVPCDCARKGTVKLGHYDVVRCPNCNCQFWALRPLRDGPLVLFPWPGVVARPAYIPNAGGTPRGPQPALPG